MNFKNISRQVILLGLVSLFTDFSSEMLYPIAPLFLTVTLGVSMSLVGLIEGIAEITAGFLKGYFGHLSDRIGKRSIFITTGYGISGIVKSIPGLIPVMPVVFFSRVTDRIGKGIRTAPRDALLAANAGGNTGAVFGFHRGMDTLGAVAGPVAALILLYFFPARYTLIYLVAFIPSIAAIGFAFAVKDVKGRSSSVGKKSYGLFLRSAPLEYKKLVFLVTLFSFANSSDVFLILKSKLITRSDFTAIMGYVLYNGIYALFSYPIGIVSDRFGKRNVFIGGLLIFSAVYAGFAVNQSTLMIWLLFGLYGIYAASTEGVTKAWVSDLVNDEFRGSAIGFLTMLSSLAVMSGSVFTGILWDNLGSVLPFIISSVISLFVGILLVFMKR